MTRTARIERAGDEPLVKNDDVPTAKAATSRKFWGVRERAYRVSNPDGLAISEGDTVEIFLPPGRTIWSAAVTFLLPLALFPVGYALAGALFPGAAGGAAAGGEALSGAAAAGNALNGTAGPGLDEGVAFLTGFGFLLAGIPLGWAIRRIAGGLTAIPRIVRVLTPAEVFACSMKAKAEGCGSCRNCG